MRTLMMTALVAGMTVTAPAFAQQVSQVPNAALADLDEEAPPAPIKGVAPTYHTPARDAAGAYLTPNRALSAAETAWHVRIALNVAALGCRDADERATVAAYNAVLAADQAPLAAAATGTERQYQVKFGAKWRAAHDDNMTRLYNFFAQTPAHDEFCTAAKEVLAEARAAAPADFATVAAGALPRLEAPFLAFYARFDAYREERAAWEARHAAPPVMVAVAIPAPVPVEAPVPMAAPAPVAIAALAPTAAPTPTMLAAK